MILAPTTTNSKLIMVLLISKNALTFRMNAFFKNLKNTFLGQSFYSGFQLSVVSRCN